MPSPSELEEFEFQLRMEREQEQQQQPSKLEAFRAEQAARDKPARPPAPVGGPGKIGAGEALLSLGTGAIAAPVAGLMSLGGLATGGVERGADFAREVQEAMTYQPRTESGKVALSQISRPFEWLGEKATAAGEAVSDVTGSPALGAATTAGVQFLPAMIGKGAGMLRPKVMGPAARPVVPGRLEPTMGEPSPAMLRYRREAAPEVVATEPQGMLPKAQQAAADEASRNFVKDETWKQARKEGYVVPPATMGTPGGKAAQIVAGKKTLTEGAQTTNQPITDRIARREAGLKPNQPIDMPNLRKARQEIAKPYQELASLSPEADEALTEMSRMRDRAQMFEHEYSRTGTVDAWEKAQYWRGQEADWNAILEDEAHRLGRDDLVPEMRAARVKLAKNYNVQAATNFGTGEVDARVIGRMYQASPERYTGGLATIGRFAQRFNEYVKPGVADYVPDTHLGTHAGPHGMNVYGWLGGGVPGLRGPVTKLALSDLMQKTPTYQPGLGVRLADIGTRPGMARGLALTPSLGLRRPEEE